MTPFFTIVTPIYNNSQYISRGCASIMAQTFIDFEWILVDDGSTDDSGYQIDKMAQKYPEKVKVFHKTNEGAGPTRNTGIKVAKGKYLAFFDIDDEVYPNWLQDAHNYLIQYHPQLMVSGYEDFLTYNNEINLRKFDFKLYDSNIMFKKDFTEKFSGIKFHNGFVWNKIYERKFIVENGFKIPSLRIQQDEAFNHLIYPHVDRVLSVPDIWYKYYVYTSGNTRSHYISERIDIYKIIRDSFLTLQKNWCGEDENLTKYIFKRFYFSLFNVINFNLFHNENKLSQTEKIMNLKTIFQDEDINFSIMQFKKSGELPYGIFGKLYFYAIQNRSINQFLIVRKLHNLISRFR